MEKFLEKTALFSGLSSEEAAEVLKETGATRKSFFKGETVLSAGEAAGKFGLVTKGSVLVEYSDVWGNNSVLGKTGEGDVFAEAYAFSQSKTVPVRVIAAEDSEAIFFDAKKILSLGNDGRDFAVVKNLLSICADKAYKLSRRIIHTSSKTIRGRLLSFFSERIRTEGSFVFEIPFDRRRLAEYLGVDRSALSAELSEMQKEGLIKYKKNRFEISEKAGIEKE